LRISCRLNSRYRQESMWIWRSWIRSSLRAARSPIRRPNAGLLRSLNRRRPTNQPTSRLKHPRSDRLLPKAPWPRTAGEYAARARAGVLLRGSVPWRAANFKKGDNARRFSGMLVIKSRSRTHGGFLCPNCARLIERSILLPKVELGARGAEWRLGRAEGAAGLRAAELWAVVLPAEAVVAAVASWAAGMCRPLRDLATRSSIRVHHPNYR
jgi:hypothetical protein